MNEPKMLHAGESLEAVWHRATLDLLAALALIEDRPAAQSFPTSPGMPWMWKWCGFFTSITCCGAGLVGQGSSNSEFSANPGQLTARCQRRTSAAISGAASAGDGWRTSRAHRYPAAGMVQVEFFRHGRAPLLHVFLSVFVVRRRTRPGALGWDAVPPAPIAGAPGGQQFFRVMGLAQDRMHAAQSAEIFRVKLRARRQFQQNLWRMMKCSGPVNLARRFVAEFEEGRPARPVAGD